MKEKINLCVKIDASYFTTEVEVELIDKDISIHYQNDVVNFWKWDEAREHYPVFQDWLLEKYGEDIKQYRTFAIIAT